MAARAAWASARAAASDRRCCGVQLPSGVRRVTQTEARSKAVRVQPEQRAGQVVLLAGSVAACATTRVPFDAVQAAVTLACIDRHGLPTVRRTGWPIGDGVRPP